MNKICTIIANYNYRDYVLKCLSSAMMQNYQNHSIVFVDDGSSDDSWDLVQKCFPLESMTMKNVGGQVLSVFEHKNLKYTRIKNSGASIARNTAIKLAGKCDAIHILDSDDFVLPNKIEIMEKVLFEYDEIGVVYGDYKILRPLYSKYEYKEPYSYGGLMEKCIVHSGSAVKTKYLNAIAPNGVVYNPKLHGPGSEKFVGSSEDYDLWLRLSNICMFVHIPKCLTIVNEHGNNQSSRMTPEIFANNMNIIRKGMNV